MLFQNLKIKRGKALNNFIERGILTIELQTEWVMPTPSLCCKGECYGRIVKNQRIDTCAAMSEKISEKLDEVDMIASEYFLEVCSPGAERELKDETQIRDALDEYVYVKLKNPKAGMDAVKGYLRAYENGDITMEYMDKAVKKKITIDGDNIALIRLSVKI